MKKEPGAQLGDTKQNKTKQGRKHYHRHFHYRRCRHCHRHRHRHSDRNAGWWSTVRGSGQIKTKATTLRIWNNKRDGYRNDITSNSKKKKSSKHSLARLVSIHQIGKEMIGGGRTIFNLNFHQATYGCKQCMIAAYRAVDYADAQRRNGGECRWPSQGPESSPESVEVPLTARLSDVVMARPCLHQNPKSTPKYRTKYRT
jgi:hypothetical protein